MLVIGLTGGIGTGKSEASRILGVLGAVVIDADRVGHEAYTPHTPAWQEVVAAFGEAVLQADGSIDRKKLGAIVFNDPGARVRLNTIMHPRMYDMIKAKIGDAQRAGAEVVVVEAALLIEAGWTSLVDEVWVVHSPEELAVQRVRSRNNLPEEEIRRRIRSQLPFEERAKHAQVIIDNVGTIEALRQEVAEQWSRRVKGKSR